jgi:hypothetical protein
MFRHLFMLLVTLLVCSGIIHAHQVDTVEFEFQRDDGYWRLQGEMDIAYMLPETRWVPDAGALDREEVMKASPRELERIRKETLKTLRKHLKLTHAGKPLQWVIEFPDFKSKPFKLPPDLGGFALLTVNLVVKQQSQPGDFVVHWGKNEKALLIILDPLSNEGVPVSVEPGNSLTLLKVSKAAGNKQGKMTEGSQVSESDGLVTERAGNSVAMSWLKSGFLHVAPKGLDHMLFILGLFLAVLAFKPMLWQSLLFTLAHSITLGACAMGWLPQWSWVEIFIAFTIAFIGIENLCKVKVGKRRYITVFVFGLIHGLGFASVFIEQVSSVPKEKLLQPLLWFNIGVEVAQISVILIAAMLMALIKKKKSKDRAQMIGSVVVTLAGLIWLTQRIFNIDLSFGLM